MGARDAVENAVSNLSAAGWKGRATFVLVALFTLAVAWLLVMWGIGTVQQIQQHDAKVRNAETTQARMVDVKYHEVDNEDEDDDFRIEMTYTYTVNGTTYQGSNLDSQGYNKVDTERAAQEFVESHPENGTFQVYYLPSDPDTAFVRKESGSQVAVEYVGFYLVVLVVGGLILKYLLGVLRPAFEAPA